jgi:hypothetical protein
MFESTTEESSRRPRKRRRFLANSLLRSLVESRWWETTFTRQGIMDAIRNLAWVAPLTILIWVYAEREQIGTPTYNDVPVNIVGSNLSITPDQSRISLELKGPQNGLERVQLAIGKAPGLEIDISNTAARGRQNINVIDHIQNQPLFRDTGVSVTKADPAEIQVNVDDLISYPIPVQSPPNVPNLEATSHYEPRMVKAHGPKLMIDSLLKQGGLTAYANLDSVGALTPGHHERIVDVSLSGKDTSITLDPTSVNASLDVRPSDETKIIPAMAIWIKAPQSVLDQYEIHNVPATVTNTTVTGPPDKLALLEKTLPTAVLTITGDDINTEQPKQLDYQLPPGVTVNHNDQARTFEFKLEKRTN